jgi:hypothetical protein
MGYAMCMYTSDYEEPQSLVNSPEAEAINFDEILTAEEIQTLSD